MLGLIDNLISRHSPLFNIALRLLSVGGRFLLSISIIKVLDTDSLGVYGLFNSSILIGVMVIGLDFYTFNTREIVKPDGGEISQKVRNQFVLHLVTYLPVLPMSLLFFVGGVIPVEYVLWFLVLLVLEHLGTELFRLLIALKLPLTANLLFFLRSASWTFGLLFLWLLGVDSVTNLRSIFAAWTLGVSSSILFGFLMIHRSGVNVFFRGPVDWFWIKQGVRTSSFFLLSSLSLKALEFSGRYVANGFLSKTDVGVIIFFQNIANLLNVLVYSGTVMIIGPRILALTERNDEDGANRMFKRLRKEIIRYTLAGIVGVLMLIYPLLLYLNRPELDENILILVLLLVGTGVNNMAYYWHYRLYSAHQDKRVMHSTFIAVGVSLTLTIILGWMLGLLGIAIGYILGFITMFVAKRSYARKY